MKKLFKLAIPSSRSLLTLIAGLGLLVLASGCSRDRTKIPARSFMPDLSDKVKAQKNQIPEKLVGPLDTSEIKACARLNQIRDKSSQRNFRLVDTLNFGTTPKSGRGDLLNNPFLQLLLADKFKVATDQEFYGLVSAKLKDAETEEEQIRWTALKCFYELANGLKLEEVCNPIVGEMEPAEAQMRFVGGKYAITNIGLKQKFPGVFGEIESIEKSFYGLLIKKLGIEIGPENARYFGYLRRKLPLFVGNTWSEQAKASQITLAAALSGLYPVDTVNTPAADAEKVCGFVLIQRNFAQLLALKGYHRPEFVAEDSIAYDGSAAIEPLDANSNPVILTKAVPGLFVKVSQTNNKTVLSSIDIATYDPRKGLILSADSPLKDFYLDEPKAFQPASLESTLGTLETLVHQFTVTSPAGPWIKDLRTYPYGDVSKLDNRAYLPADAHSLALGLIGVVLTNFAALNVKQIDAKGLATDKPDQAVGLVIGSLADLKKGNSRLAIKDLLTALRVLTNFRLELKRISSLPKDTLLSINPLYTRQKLAELFGTEIFTQSEVDAILTEEQKAGILFNKLKSLSLPLYLYLKQFGAGPTGCSQFVKWDLKTGAHSVEGKCTEAEVAERALQLKRLRIISKTALI